MSDEAAQSWKRISELATRFNQTSAAQWSEVIDSLLREGESDEVISYLRRNYLLPNETWGVKNGDLVGGRYRLQEKLGQGGMGVVYRAVQEHVDREVALKMVHPALATPQMVHRLAREIGLLGRLNHPFIVRIFDADVHHDAPGDKEVLFYTMEMVGGRRLDAWVKELQPNLEQRLECFAAICDAVAYAHELGVVHRDLKPENILVGDDGRPAILDFGLARVTEVAFSRGQSKQPEEHGSVIWSSGTPAYMSPERWERQDAGEVGDIYSLGVILFEVISGKRPWEWDRDASLMEIRQIMLHSDPRRLSEAAPEAGASLDRLVAHMMAPDPSDRPPSATFVANELRRILARWRRRKIGARLAPLAAVLAAVLAVLAVGARLWWIDYLAGRRTDEASIRALNEARQELNTTSARKLERVLTLVPKSPEERHSEEEWRAQVITALEAPQLLSRTLPDSLPRGFMPFAVDATGLRYFGWAMKNNFWMVVDLGYQEATYMDDSRYFANVTDARFHPEEEVLAVRLEGGILELWNWETKKIRRLESISEATEVFAFAPNGNWLAVETIAQGKGNSRETGPISTIHLIETSGREEYALTRRGDPLGTEVEVPISTRPLSGLAFSPDSRYLASWSDLSLYCLIWDLSEGELEQVSYHRAPVRAAAWQPDNSGRLAAVQRDGLVSFWQLDAARGNLVRADELIGGMAVSTSAGFVGQIAWLPGNYGLGLADQNSGTISMIDFGLGGKVLEFSLDEVDPESLRWHVGDQFWSASLPKHTWEEWRLMEPVLHRHADLGFLPCGVVFDPEGNWIVTAGPRETLFLRLQDMKVVHRGSIPLSGPVDFSLPEGDLWAYTKSHGPLRWQRQATGDKTTFQLLGGAMFSDVVGTFDLAQSSSHIAASRDNRIFVERMPSKQRPQAAVIAPGKVSSVELAESGDWLAAVWDSDSLRGAGVWHKREDRWERISLEVKPLIVAIPPWNEQLLLGMPRQILRRALPTLEELPALPLQNSTAESRPKIFASSPEAPVLACLVGNREIKLFDFRVEPPRVIAQLEAGIGNSSSVHRLALSRDGCWLAAVVREFDRVDLWCWDLASITQTLEGLNLLPTGTHALASDPRRANPNSPQQIEFQPEHLP